MSDEWQYQVRIDLPEELATVARARPDDEAGGELPVILARHHATLKSQGEASDQVAEAERQGVERIRYTNG